MSLLCHTPNILWYEVSVLQKRFLFFIVKLFTWNPWRLKSNLKRYFYLEVLLKFQVFTKDVFEVFSSDTGKQQSLFSIITTCQIPYFKSWWEQDERGLTTNIILIKTSQHKNKRPRINDDNVSNNSSKAKAISTSVSSIRKSQSLENVERRFSSTQLKSFFYSFNILKKELRHTSTTFKLVLFNSDSQNSNGEARNKAIRPSTMVGVSSI